MTFKKFFTGLISLSAALLAVGAIAVSAGAETSGDFKYEILDDGTVEITDYSGSATELEVPSTLDEKNVTSVGRMAFYDCADLTSITIPDGVTSIGKWAFSECASLTSITLPDSVTNIEQWAFSGCSSLTSITIPNGVTSIKEMTFYNCSSLASVTIPESVTSIKSQAFWHCSSLDSIILPESITSLGYQPFSDTPLYDNQTTTVKYAGNWVIGCDKDATTATIKSGTIGTADSAFERCSSLTSITIPDSMTSLGDSAFSYCTSLASITIPDGVTSIGTQTFWNCPSLTTIIIPDTLTSVGSKAFGWCNSIKDVYYTGSKDQWEQITIPTDNDKLLNADIHYLDLGVSGLELKGRSGDALRITWEENTSADGYIIEMKDGDTWKRVGKLTDNSTVEFKKSKLEAGTAYTLRVKAYKMIDKTAVYSGYTTISAMTNPSVITGLTLKARAADALRLIWTENTSADGYIIEMKDGDTWKRVGKLTDNSTVEFKKSKLEAGAAYTFRVKAYKMSGKTALYGATKTISARTNPTAISGLKVKAIAKSSICIAWEKNMSADGYIIEMKDGDTWKRVGKLKDSSAVEFNKYQLKAGTAYTFRVKTYKMSGKTALYGATKTISARTNPTAISGLKLKVSAKSSICLAWEKNMSADGYIIEMKDGDTWKRVGKLKDNSVVEFNKYQLKAGTTYTFRVKTYKMSGKTALYGSTKTITVKTK